MPAAGAMEAASLLSDFIEEPEAAAQAAAVRPPIALGVFFYFLSAGTVYLAEMVAEKSVLFGGSGFGLGIVCVWNAAWGLLLSSLVHVFAEGLGGRGKATALFALLGFSEMGWLLLLPAALIAQAVSPGGTALFRAGFIFAGLLVFALKSRSIRLLYGIPAMQAAAALAAPYVSLIIAVALGMLVGIWSLAAAAFEAFS